MSKLVSVVIPTHNRADLLERAVKSACAQTYKSIEVVVVSDGFDYQTDILMKKIASQDNRVRYIVYDPCMGGNHARNTGIKQSLGEYVAFLDDDDVWYENKIEKQFGVIDKDEKIGLVCTAMNAIYEGEKATVLFIPPAQYDAKKQILMENCIGSTTTVMVRKELFDKCGYFDESLGAQQDYDMWIRLCQITKVGVVRDACVDYYNYNNANQISKDTKKYEAAVAYLENKYAEYYKTLTVQENRRRKSHQYLNIGKKALRNNDPKTARKFIELALKEHVGVHAIECYIGSFIEPKTARKVRSVLRKIKYHVKA